MTPASDSEARKRAGAQPVDVADPVEALRVLADEILHEDLTDVSVTAWRGLIAARLDALVGEVVPRLIPKPTTERVPEWPTTKPPTADELLDYLAATALGCATVGPELVGAPDKWTANHEGMVWAHDLFLAMSWIQARDANAADDLAERIWEADDEGDGYQEAAWRWCIARHVAAEEVQRRAVATAKKGGRSATERVRLDQVIGRQLPGERWLVDEVIGDPTGWTWRHQVGAEERPLPVADDGTVEVLVGDES